MYAIYDSVAMIFLNPISLTNDGDAVRWFAGIINNKEEKSNISNHPEQFSIYRLLDYNDKTGKFEHSDADKERGISEGQYPKLLITGVECQEEQERKFTVKELITMLKMELGQDNVIDLANAQSATKSGVTD